MLQRTEIRYYITEMLKDSVDVGDKVFANSPHPRFLSDAPCVLVYFGNETIDIEGGDKYCAHEYDRTLAVNTDILTLESEDHLDFLGGQIEKAFSDDWFLGKRLSEYSATNRCGLSRGVTLTSVVPYEIDSGSENIVYGQRLTWSVPYVQELYSTEKLGTWDEYRFEITKTDDSAVDPILSAGEGDIGEE